MSDHVLEVSKLTKDYDTHRAVENLSFDISKGEVLGLLGPNGAGKSTTIQILLGITSPTSGEIKYFGQDFKRNRQRCLQRVNFASAYNNLLDRITVKDNLVVFANAYLTPKPLQKIAELLEYFEIDHLSKIKYNDLSAGERTRVNLAKSLLNDPELILMDEPTASLDPDIADKTLSLIEQLRDERKLSILFTSHNMQEVTRICNQVIFLDRGHLVSKDTPANHIKKLKGAKLVVQFRGDNDKIINVLDKLGEGYEIVGHKLVSINLQQEKTGETIAQLVNNGLDITDVEVDKPTLEDVFLDIARRKKL